MNEFKPFNKKKSNINLVRISKSNINFNIASVNEFKSPYAIMISINQLNNKILFKLIPEKNYDLDKDVIFEFNKKLGEYGVTLINKNLMEFIFESFPTLFNNLDIKSYSYKLYHSKDDIYFIDIKKPYKTKGLK